MSGLNDTVKTYADFEQLVATTFTPEPYGIRYGQHWFNVLVAVKPRIAEVIRGSRLDPFYRDAVSDDAKALAVELW